MDRKAKAVARRFLSNASKGTFLTSYFEAAQSFESVFDGELEKLNQEQARHGYDPFSSIAEVQKFEPS